MCGRYSLATPAEALVELLGLSETPELAPRYNVAPTQPVPAVGRRDASQPRRLALLSWGVRPGGPKGPLLINARAETAEKVAAFRDSFLGRRCLIPADGFYEWKREGQRKQPFRIQREDGRPFAFAGLWAPAAWTPQGAACAILTTAPNELLRGLHDRMPVILPPEAYAAWLDPELVDPRALRALLVPAPEAGWLARPVSTRVNDVRNDDPACLAPVV